VRFVGVNCEEEQEMKDCRSLFDALVRHLLWKV
jgi:hypothetical protein